MSIELRLLEIDDRDFFLDILKDDWGDFPFLHYFESLANSDFEKYVTILKGLPAGDNLPAGHVPCTFLFAFDEQGQIVGRVSIRHKLTEDLTKFGGHVGFAIREKFRRRGYAKEVLSQSLLYIRESLETEEKILVTCDHDNIGSIKIIKSCGGVLENQVENTKKGITNRYWISL